MNKPFRIELDGRLVAECDEAGETLQTWHELASAHDRPLADFDAYIEVLLNIDPDETDWYDVSPQELAAMEDYAERQADWKATGGY